MIADVVILILFSLFVYNGYKKGFIKSVYSILSLVATIILVSIFKDTFVKAISESPIGVAIGEFVVGNSEDAALAPIYSQGIVYLVSVIIFYILIRFVLRFTLTIINSIASLPIVSSLNKFLGLVLGIVIAIVWIVVIVGVLSTIPKASKYIEDSLIVEYFKIIFI